MNYLIFRITVLYPSLDLRSRADLAMFAVISVSRVSVMISLCPVAALKEYNSRVSFTLLNSVTYLDKWAIVFKHENPFINKTMFLQHYLFRSRLWTLIELPFLCLFPSPRFVWPQRHCQDGLWIFLEAAVWTLLISSHILQDQLREPFWARIYPVSRFVNWQTGLLCLVFTRNFICVLYDLLPIWFSFENKIFLLTF